MEAKGTGQLPPVVLLHGFGASGAQMFAFLSRLRSHVRRLIVPDLPAHGFSDVPSTGVTKENLQAGLFETLDRFINEPVVLFGNSMGGFAAIRYATAHPEGVQAMVLCSPGGAAMSDEELDAFRKIFFLNNHTDAVEFVERLLGKKSRLRHVFAVSVRRKLNRNQIRRLIEEVQPEDLLQPDELSGLKMPLFMIWGQADGILPRQSRHFFVDHLPHHARVLEPEALGHSPYLENPRALTTHMVSFLSEVLPA